VQYLKGTPSKVILFKWNGAALRIVQYQKGSPGKVILFKWNGNINLVVYTDADYVGSIVDRRSTTKHCTFLGGNLVTKEE